MNDDPLASALDPRDAFARGVRAPDARIELARCALWIAAEEYPGLDVPHYLARLDELVGPKR